MPSTRTCPSCGANALAPARAPLTALPAVTFSLALVASIVALYRVALGDLGAVAYAVLAAALASFIPARVPTCAACRMRVVALPPPLSPDPPRGLKVAASQPAFTLFLVCLMLFLSLGTVAQVANVEWGLWYSEVFLFLAPALLFARLAGLDARRFVRWEWPGALVLVAAALVAVGNFPLVNLVVVLSHKGFDAAGLSWLVEKSNVAVKLLEQLGGARAAIAVSAVSLAAPLGEETLFRGFMLTTLRARYGTAWAIAIVAVLFAALHLDLVNFLGLAELAVVFALLSLRARSLWAAVVAHGVHNFASSVVLYTTSEPDKDPPLAEAFAWALAGAACVAVGVWLFRLATRERASRPPEPVRPLASPAKGWTAVAAVVALGIACLGLLVWKFDALASLSRLAR